MPQVNPIVKKGLQDKALALILDGSKRNNEIIAELGVPRKAFYSWKKSLSKGTQMGTIRQSVKLEVSQENALSELTRQLQQYTDNYDKAMEAAGQAETEGEAKSLRGEAHSWSARRVDLLKEMLKVTGLYAEGMRPKPDKDDPDADVERMTDQELRDNAAKLLAKGTQDPQ